MVLKVIDDGIGFGEGKVSSMGTGLVNIRKRLHFYYGDEFSLDIKSQPQKGTEVTMVLPFVPDADDEYVPVFWFGK